MIKKNEIQKEDILNILEKIYIWLSEKKFRKIEENLNEHNNFMFKYGGPGIIKCPEKDIEAYTPIQVNFLESINIIKNDLEKMEINRENLLPYIKFCKKNKMYGYDLLFDKISCVAGKITDYHFMYHHYRSTDLVNGVLGSIKTFIIIYESIEFHELKKAI